MKLFERKKRVRISDVESSYKPKARAGIVCEHELIAQTLKDRQRFYDHRPDYVVDPQCGKTASYSIEGRNYCGNHAGMVAINLLRLGVWRA